MNRVLLIDDEPMMADLVQQCLADTQVVVAPGLDEAIAASRAGRPNVVLLDISLGSADGLDLLDDLRREPALHGVPIVGFSVHDSREREARERGVDDFVAKPFRTTALREAVAPWLQEAR